MLNPSTAAIPCDTPTPPCPIHCSPCECLSAVDDAWTAQRIDLHRAIGTELVQSTRSLWDESIALHEVVEQLVDADDDGEATALARPWSSMSSGRASPWPPWSMSTSSTSRAALGQLSDFQRAQWDQTLARVRNVLTANPPGSVDVLLRVGHLAPSIALIALAAPRSPARSVDDAAQAGARAYCPWLCFAASFLGAAEPQQDQSKLPRPGTAHRASITALRDTLRVEKERLQRLVNLLRDLLERHADTPRSGAMSRGSATPEALAVAVELMHALQAGHRAEQDDEQQAPRQIADSAPDATPAPTSSTPVPPRPASTRPPATESVYDADIDLLELILLLDVTDPPAPSPLGPTSGPARQPSPSSPARQPTCTPPAHAPVPPAPAAATAPSQPPVPLVPTPSPPPAPRPPTRRPAACAPCRSTDILAVVEAPVLRPVRAPVARGAPPPPPAVRGIRRVRSLVPAPGGGSHARDDVRGARSAPSAPLPPPTPPPGAAPEAGAARRRSVQV